MQHHAEVLQLPSLHRSSMGFFL